MLTRMVRIVLSAALAALLGGGVVAIQAAPAAAFEPEVGKARVIGEEEPPGHTPWE